jgi:YfiH family protein
MSPLTVVTSPLLSSLSGVRHAFFTRQGGVSTGVYESLNVGLGSADDPASVAENRERCARWFGAPPASLFTCYQIHSARAHRAGPGWARPEGDAVIAAAAELVCGALSADCAPILMADPKARVVAAAHAGWKGALGGVVEAALDEMERAGAHRARVVAAVGPCIGPASYEVGEEFLARFASEDPGSERFFLPGADPAKRMFDLPAYVLGRLGRAGIAQAESVGRDTYVEPEAFFSNRRAVHRGEADYGRLLSAIMLD